MAAVDRFIEEMGLVLQDSGAPRIAGRIFGLLLAEGREMSLSQISERLGVSRASVSTNTRLLAKGGVLKLTTRAGDRQDYYQMVQSPYTDMIGDVATRFRRYAATMQACAAALRAEDQDAAKRIDHLTGFYSQSAEILDQWAKTLRQRPPQGDSE